jgi:transposase
VNIIAAIGSSGERMYSINKGKTNAITFLLFIVKLLSSLDQEDSNWRSNSLLLIDNAPYHRSKSVRNFLISNNVPVLFLGPYQFNMAPVEKFFSFIKCRELNVLSTRLNTRYES